MSNRKYTYIIKADGSKERFQQNKLYSSLLKSKLVKDLARQVTRDVASRITKKTTTEDIRKITFQKLCRKHLPYAQLYNLRIALAELPPKKFEFYIKKLLEEDGYQCEWEKIIRGAATRHEVDVIAKKEPDLYLIECKHRVNFRKYSGLGKVLQVQARFEDIVDGFKKKTNTYNFTRAWVINNAKFSGHAKQYAQAKNIWLCGWGYPKHLGLAEWVQHLEVYPVTILRMKRKLLSMFISRNILTFQDVLTLSSKRGESISREVYQNLVQQIKAIKQC